MDGGRLEKSSYYHRQSYPFCQREVEISLPGATHPHLHKESCCRVDRFFSHWPLNEAAALANHFL